MKVKEIADILKGKVSGDGQIEIRRFRWINDAEKGDITVYFKKYENILDNTEASAFLHYEPLIGKTTIVVRKELIKPSIKKLYELFELKEDFNHGIHPTVVIGEEAKIGKNVEIGAYSVIGKGVEIGDNTKIYPMVVIYPKVKIGKNCKIHSGVVLRSGTEIGDEVEVDSNAVLASAGFQRGFKKETLEINPLCGGVRIGNKAFVGALSHISKSVANETTIGEGTKIDALVYIGHGVKIGKHCRIAGQSGLSGDVKIEDEVSIGGQCGLADDVRVGKKAFIASRSGVLKNVEEGAYVVGTPAIDVKLWKRIQVLLRNLPSLWEKIKKL